MHAAVALVQLKEFCRGAPGRGQLAACPAGIIAGLLCIL